MVTGLAGACFNWSTRGEPSGVPITDLGGFSAALAGEEVPAGAGTEDAGVLGGVGPIFPQDLVGAEVPGFDGG